MPALNSPDASPDLRTVVCRLLPWDENERLAALRGYDVLDTASEPAFDEITHIAALVCQAPIALVSLVEDRRQWFKARLGTDLPDTPLDVSFCAFAMLEPELTVVPDATRDPRFQHNGLVTGAPFIRFYAGARLETPEGLPIGTICILDTKARPEGLTQQQAQTLRALARQVMAQLELRRTVADLERAQEGQELLTRELGHRIQNIFAVVGGLAAASARNEPGAQNFVRGFRERLGALAQAHDYVRPRVGGSPASAAGQTVRGLMEIVLAPYRDAEPGRLRIDGDDTPIGTHAATALALIVHEQATNAVKYGALSTSAGTVAIRAARADGRFELTWEERGGPPVAGPPAQPGFGTVMTERSAQGQLDGTIARSWMPQGLRMTLSAPIESLAR